MPVDCQACGARVAAAEWPQHLTDHFHGRVSTLPAAYAFLRHPARAPGSSDFCWWCLRDGREEPAILALVCSRTPYCLTHFEAWLVFDVL